jgi:hypothetical protein
MGDKMTWPNRAELIVGAVIMALAALAWHH